MISEKPIKDGRIIFSDAELKLESIEVTIKNLEKLIGDINNDLTAKEVFQAKLQVLIKDLHLEASTCLQFYDIAVFGSSMNGFRNRASDIDVVVDLKQDGIEHQLWVLRNYLVHSEVFQLKQVIVNANVPLITVRHCRTQMDCDISFATPTICRNAVIYNTNLLKAYSNNFPEIAEGFRFFKHIINFTKFGSVRTFGLSTYTHIILFIYFLTHKRKPKTPFIDPKTLTLKCNQRLPNLSAAELIIDYLRYISCELDSSKVELDIRSPHNIPRSSHYGSLGQLTIPDPYIKKDLGRYMKVHQLYHFKLFCYNLLQHLLSNASESVHQLNKWCSEYNVTSFEVPNFSLKCSKCFCIELIWI